MTVKEFTELLQKWNRSTCYDDVCYAVGYDVYMIHSLQVLNKICYVWLEDTEPNGLTPKQIVRELKKLNHFLNSTVEFVNDSTNDIYYNVRDVQRIYNNLHLYF